MKRLDSTFSCQNLARLVAIITAVLVQTSLYSRHSVLPKAKLITRFNFSLTSKGIIIIKGRFGNFPDTLNFILDTGCGGISLDSTTVRHFNLAPERGEEMITGIAQKKQVEYIRNQQLQLPGLLVKNLDFHINDYTFLNDSYNLKIHGVIGYSFLKSYIVKINYDDLLMEVWEHGSMNYPEKGHLMPAGVNRLAAINAAIIDNREINASLYFDTGADICFLLTDRFIQDSNVLINNKKIFAAEGEGLGGKKNMSLTTLNEVRIGPYTLKKVPVHIFNDEFNVANYPRNSGVIGNELLQRFNLILNYPSNKIHLLPNKNFSTPFNYSYTGFSIIVENGKLVVKDILQDSPADVAGLKSEDIILGINNNFRNNIADYQSLFEKAGSRLKVFFLRAGQIKSAILEVKSIL